MSAISKIENFYKDAFRTLDKKKKVPEIVVEFYPYIGIKHTIRQRGDTIFIRLSELCRDAPDDAQKSLAFILVGKILKKKIPRDAENAYLDFAKSAEMREKSLENKIAKGRKIITDSKGDVYDLNKIFDSLNRDYFASDLPKPTLSWSARKTFRRLGHYDSAHETIIISKTLDDKKVPEFVVEFVVYHEMLHIFHPTQIKNGRRYHHTPEFQRDEEKFENFHEAEDWIDKNIGARTARPRVSKRR